MMLDKKLAVVLRTVSSPTGELVGPIKMVTLDNDLDGDGRSDPILFRAKERRSYGLHSADGETVGFSYSDWDGVEPMPFFADFDGDAMADMAYCHIDWSNGHWTFVYQRSSDGTVGQIKWGNEWLNDKTALGDYDGNGTIDIAVFRESEGLWLITSPGMRSPRYEWWGMTGDRPCPGDYDGDGIADLCVVRVEKNRQLAWYIRRSSDGSSAKIFWGLSSDTLPEYPVDVDADGANDLFVSRNEDGQRVFYALRSSDMDWSVLHWGVASDAVKLGDFDGDGMTDFAAVRPVDRQLVWFVSSGRSGKSDTFFWGQVGDN
jgi:hypothetical protein